MASASPRRRRSVSTRQAASPGTIQSLRRGLQILDVIGQQGGRLALTEIARCLDMHFSTTHHLVKTLQTCGYVAQDQDTREYRLSTHVFQLAAVAWDEDALARLGEPVVTSLAHETGHTAHLAVLDQRNALVIRKFDAEGPWRLASRVGTQRPVHCTALGKVLLAFQKPELVRGYLAVAELEALTPRSITGKRRLEEELAKVRGQGYAIDDEEYAEGIRCLAAPVFNFTGGLAAALGISGPAWSLTRERLEQLAGAVQELAQRLSRELGHHPPRAAGRPPASTPARSGSPRAGRATRGRRR